MPKKNGRMKAAKGKTAAMNGKRPPRMIITTEECIKRMMSFPERMEKIVAAIRKGKSRGVSS